MKGTDYEIHLQIGNTRPDSDFVYRGFGMGKQMKWISSEEKNPENPGLYGAFFNDVPSDPFCFSFAYWDGKGWVLPTQSDAALAPYRPVRIWCILEIGKG